MSTEEQYTIRPYAPVDNAGLAVMWNESDDRWPGTFNGGVPMTEARVAEWMEREVSLMRLVVQEKTTDAIVGYGSLWEEKTRPDTCYVDLLNVHPGHQGRSLARRMLTDMVDWATEQGYDRMTIGTWSANLYAMPLYKKVGYFWVPDTQVFMESFVPAIRRLAIAQPFFAKHDWYRTYAASWSRSRTRSAIPPPVR
ncbi:MAG: GNAT family N-acetyltransferase [Caldilineaceae bacterium]|nr:GNAT family N-acetyltransferase [Caldilineaceae bacterium]